MEAISVLRCVKEQYQMDQQDLHLIFINLENMYDRVPKEFFLNPREERVRIAYI